MAALRNALTGQSGWPGMADLAWPLTPGTRRSRDENRFGGDVFRRARTVPGPACPVRSGEFAPSRFCRSAPLLEQSGARRARSSPVARQSQHDVPGASHRRPCCRLEVLSRFLSGSDTRRTIGSAVADVCRNLTKLSVCGHEKQTRTTRSIRRIANTPACGLAGSGRP